MARPPVTWQEQIKRMFTDTTSTSFNDKVYENEQGNFTIRTLYCQNFILPELYIARTFIVKTFYCQNTIITP